MNTQPLSPEVEAPLPSSYLVGAGIYDITGPAGGVPMMGFAVPSQRTSGIHMRLRARAFVVGDGQRRVVFVSADLGMLFQMVKLKVCERVAQDPELRVHYDERNILLSATHTHGGPGGYSGYLLYDLGNKGLLRRHFDAIVDGIFQAIRRAHRNLEPGRIFVKQCELEGVGSNRAVEPYEANPAAERALYAGNTDTSFTLLKFVAADGRALGMVNWFAVHPDSIGPRNTLITGDNKGYASYLFERAMGADYAAERTFVAAFAQANAGDVTPNIGFGRAPRHVELALNPSLANAVSKQYDKARALYEEATEELTGPVDSRHEWVDMTTLYVERAGTTTCAAGMGASFSAGSPFDNASPVPLFDNGMTTDALTWDVRPMAALLYQLLRAILGVLFPISRDSAYRTAHAEKPVLLPTGLACINRSGVPMAPQRMPLQILRIGKLAIIAVPSEVTTMAGRRFKRVVRETLGTEYAVVAALSNSYASYLATREEYAKQWYEGACTPFGPHQHAAFAQEFERLAHALAEGYDVPPGVSPRDVTGLAWTLTPKVWFDWVPPFKQFGSVRQQPAARYQRGQVVEARFWAGHPNHDYRAQGTFLLVEKRVADSFVAVARDEDPEALFHWRRLALACSEVTVSWNTHAAEPGIYRIRHLGDCKRLLSGEVRPYEGTTREFEVC